MGIELVRIDDRLIHGQVVMAWTKAVKATRIVVVDDKVATDAIRKMLLETVAPPGVKVAVLTVAQAVAQFAAQTFVLDRVLLLVTAPLTIVALVEAGLLIKEVNIGGMSYRQGKKQITKAVSIDEEDRQAFASLRELGIAMHIQVVPSDSPEDIAAKL